MEKFACKSTCVCAACYEQEAMVACLEVVQAKEQCAKAVVNETPLQRKKLQQKGESLKKWEDFVERALVRITTISKRVAKVLRHDRKTVLDAQGYAAVNYVARRCKCSPETIYQVVRIDTKKRFGLKRSDHGSFVRAEQGHSNPKVNISHRLLKSAECRNLKVPILHGTSLQSWKQIQATGGLKRMKRSHVHLAKGWHATSGMRANTEVVLVVDVVAAIEEVGLEFFESANGVVLCAADIPLKFITVQGNGVFCSKTVLPLSMPSTRAPSEAGSDSEGEQEDFSGKKALRPTYSARIPWWLRR